MTNALICLCASCVPGISLLALEVRLALLSWTLAVPFATKHSTAFDCVCFCDIPLADLHVHIQKYGRFGLSFNKSFLLPLGVNPVFYVGVDTPMRTGLGNSTRADHFQHAIIQLQRIESELHDRMTLVPQLKQLYGDLTEVNHFLRAYVFGFSKPFSESQRLTDPDNYYMEREWRVHGDIRFTLRDVRRVFLPEMYAERLRRDLPEYHRQLHFV